MKKVLEELKRKLEDPIEVERMRKYFNDILIKEDNDFKRVNKFFNDDKTFEVFLLKLIKKSKPKLGKFISYLNNSEIKGNKFKK